MVAQLVEDRVHAERRRDRLDQDRRLDRAAVEAERLLRDHERVAPQGRLVLRLQFRDVEVRAPASLEQRLGVPVHVQPEVHERARHRPPVHLEVVLGQVKSAGTYVEDGGVLTELVVLALLVVLDAAVDGVGQVDLPFHHVAPVRGVRVLEVRHEAARPRIERVDHHLPARGPRDLHPPVLKGVGDRSDGELLGRPGELERLAGVLTRLALRARVEQLPAAAVQLLVEAAYQRQSFGCQGFFL